MTLIELVPKRFVKNSKMLVMVDLAMVLFYFEKFLGGLPVSRLFKYQISVSY